MSDGLRWTTDRPGTPGFYWVRHEDGDEDVVYYRSGYVYEIGDGPGGVPVGTIKGAKWAGPLYPPTKGEFDE